MKEMDTVKSAGNAIHNPDARNSQEGAPSRPRTLMALAPADPSSGQSNSDSNSEQAQTLLVMTKTVNVSSIVGYPHWGLNE